MVILSSQRMQRLAEKLQLVERSVERGGSEVEGLREEGSGETPSRGEGHEFEEDLTSASARVGVDLHTVRRMDAETLARMLSRGAGGGGGRLWAAAEILFVDGLTARARGESTVARARWEKAAFLYRRLGAGLELPEGATPPEERVERIEAWVAESGHDG